MKLFLAGAEAYRYIFDETIEVKAPFLLQTFYDLRNKKDEQIKQMLNNCDDFILDSGAFTFMNTGKQVNWKQYVDSYIDFINKYDIKNFIELDLDYIKGLEYTEKVRRYIEYHTSKKTIPVWHSKTRNLEYYDYMLDNYSYIALSTMETPKQGIIIHYDDKLLRTLVKRAHSKNVKVHGLGYMSLKEINKPNILFDTMDSSSWNGSIWGHQTVYKHGIVSKQKASKELTSKQISKRDYETWVKIALGKSKGE